MRLNLLPAVALGILALAAIACAHDRPDEARSAEAQLTSVRASAPTPEQLRVPTPPPAAAIRAELQAAQEKKDASKTSEAAVATAGADGGTSADPTNTLLAPMSHDAAPTESPITPTP